MHPLDLDTRGLRRAAAALQRHLRDVKRRHPPAALGEPHGVSALAAADVERAARPEARDLGDERTVWPTAPHPARSGVPAVPLTVVIHPAGSVRIVNLDLEATADKKKKKGASKSAPFL